MVSVDGRSICNIGSIRECGVNGSVVKVMKMSMARMAMIVADWACGCEADCFDSSNELCHAHGNG